MRNSRSSMRKFWANLLALSMAGFGVTPATAQEGPPEAGPGSVTQTIGTPIELPVEIEVETGPASLKQAPLWKELYQLLEHPYLAPTTDTGFGPSGVERRPGFGVEMPPLNVWSICYNFLTAQPLRVRTSDEEVSWDQPGPLFDPDQVVPTDAYNAPTVTRDVIGHLVACPNAPPYEAADVPADFCDDAEEGSLVVYNPDGHLAIPPDGTVVAEPACEDGILYDDGEMVEELEAPVNEEDFFRPEDDLPDNLPEPLEPYVGRLAAEVLGKAAFWDMQFGSDGVQSCGSCHFHAGADNRTRNQINPNTNGGDTTDIDIQSAIGSPTTNFEVQASDFPFHKRTDPDLVGDGQDPAVLASDANDVMSSMGVSEFKEFVDIPAIGISNFLPPSGGIRALAPDVGNPVMDPVAVNQGVRRVEPRNTPTFHGAAFNFDNFWDARARFAFNGGSVFGAADPQAHIWINPTLANAGNGPFAGATMGDLRPELLDMDEEEFDPVMAAQPVRIKFSSLASQATGPPLSDFEMSFAGRNWPKIGKKILQGDEGNIERLGDGPPQRVDPFEAGNREQAVVPLGNQLVATDDSRLGPFSNQGGSICDELYPGWTAPSKPGLCISYPDLIRLAFAREYWNRNNRHLEGVACEDPFDGYCLSSANGAANKNDTDEFTQMEANFSLFFGLAVQAYEQLTIPDDTLFDQFADANPRFAQGIGQPGEQGVLFPTLVPGLVGLGEGEVCPPNTTQDGVLCLPDGFGPEELYGMDIFMGGNLTAALELGSYRNPDGFGSNPFARTARCMQCHLGPEQTDHSINISHGIIKGDAEFEFPTPPLVPDPGHPENPAACFFQDCMLPAPEAPGSIAAVGGLILAEEVGEGAAQDAVEVEPRNFTTLDDPGTPWDDSIVAQQQNFAFGDQGIYNIGLRPIADDLGRGGDDPFGWPLSLAALTLKNIGGVDFEPCDESGDTCVMENFDPEDISAEDGGPGQQGFEETGDGAEFEGSPGYTLQAINPGFERSPIHPQMPEYMVPWLHDLPAGELHPEIDEMAGMVPNTLTPPNGGPAIEFGEVLFGADLHCGTYDPAAFGAGPPNYGWGPECPNPNSGVAGNLDYPKHGTWPVPNRVLRQGAFKAPALRNVELTGPYFHTGSYLTLRQVVDFYMRGGDFPVTNAESRDPNILDVNRQSFGFGPTNDPSLGLIDCTEGNTTGCDSSAWGYLVGNLADALPDGPFRYGWMPDTMHPFTPEPASSNPEEAKVALVKFLLALTDERVKYERAPFDRPEIFVPIDGAAPENAGGPMQLVGLSGGAPCPVAGPGSAGPCFRRISAVGAGGGVEQFPFLVSSTPAAGPNNDHFDR